MSDETRDELSELLRREYNPPPEVPREEMWAAIHARMEPRQAGVISLGRARLRRSGLIWRAAALSAAAAAVLVLGVGIGRLTAPVATPVAEAPAPAEAGPDAGVLRGAAVEHLERTEALIRMVRADGASGRVDPAVGAWARGLLTQTRLFLDASRQEDPAIQELFEDLELVLVQIVGVAEAAGGSEARAREELTLTLDGIERRDVLSRIEAVVPPMSGLAGT
ncbi:MAG: hypothetical protein FIA95_11790 [Gemmatimonadetes bacterium]|nr:hypothetical protein [Gemmatimonadota bacterium]